MVSQKLVMFAIMVVIIVVCVGREVMAIPGHFTATWSVHIEGGRSIADQVAAELGFINLGEIIGDHYHFLHTEVKKRSPYPCRHHHQRLNNHERTRWVRQEKIISRRKRDFLPLTKPSTATTNDSKLVTGGTDKPSTTATATTAAKAPSLHQSNKDSNNADRPDRELPEPKSTSTERRARISPPINDDSYYPWNDQRWAEMWYLNRGGGLDMNVVEAWKEGVTGRGIVVTILDDGLEKDHPDLIENYDPQASYDVNNHDEDPQPRYDMIDSNRHGTRCAGEVAATANNTLCAVGIAFGAKVGGVRMLDGDVTDAVEARSLSLNPQHIDIYSASWGPDDDGKTVDGPGELATRAFIEGVTKGRNGKGSIFIWASGNGGNDRDNCNCDGYTNSIWTLSISSATENGDVPWYSEMCSSTLATTYSSGSSSEKQVVTTDLHHACTSSHTGTSASAPLAAGICALALEANKELTWRDMQHIVVRTAKPANLQPTTWRSNGVGRNVSHSFGYGLMDAAAMVRLARVWRTVPVQQRCECSAPQTEKIIPPKSQVVLQLAVNQCFGVNYLEHVQAKISLSASRRGDLEINLISPAGTRVTLLAPRLHDNSRAGFNMWPFMSVHTWGESPYGIWQLEIHNEGKYMVTLTKWDMIFYGTEIPPQGEPDYNAKARPDPLESGVELTVGEGEAGQHNSIDDAKKADSWRDLLKTRDDGRVDQQPNRPSTNAEHATSGCLNPVNHHSPNCIECRQDYFMYSGQCYKSCPEKTYANHAVTLDVAKPKMVEVAEELSSSLKRSTPPVDIRNLNTKSNVINIEDLKTMLKSPQNIKANMNEHSINILAQLMHQNSPKFCNDCHYSCLTCSGPNNNQCTSCPGDAELVSMTNGIGYVKESYCYPSRLLPEIENGMLLHRFYILFGILIFIILSGLLYFIISRFMMNCGLCHKNRHESNPSSVFGYNRLGDKEKDEMKGVNVQKEIHSAIFEDTDSDSEDNA